MHPSPARLTIKKGGDVPITREEKNKYRETEILKKFLSQLNGLKFRLDCGHHVTFGYPVGNDITIYNGKTFKIVCSRCGY